MAVHRVPLCSAVCAGNLGAAHFWAKLCRRVSISTTGWAKKVRPIFYT